MRVQVGSWMLLAMAGMAAASPVPPPPDDFASLQYIDGKGCVYERDGGDWVARRDGAGEMVCGFPPSTAARRTDPAAERILPPGNQPAPPTAEDLLMQQLASGLRQGEFTADPLSPEARRAPEPPKRAAPLQVELGEVLDRTAAFRATMTAAGGTSADLCDLLGYRPDAAARPILGADVTQGLCPGMRAPTPEARIREGARLDVAAAPPSGPPQPAPAASVAVAEPAVAAPVPPPAATHAQVATAQPAPEPAVPAADSDAEPDTKPASEPAVIADRRTAADARPAGGAPAVVARTGTAEPPATVEMIPASARFVQVGSFTDDRNATLTIRRLTQMGFRVGQTFARRNDQRVRVILAGPFPTRQALVTALNHLRENGYPKAVAR